MRTQPPPRNPAELVPYARGIIRAVVAIDLIPVDPILAQVRVSGICEQLGDDTAEILDRAARLLLVAIQRGTEVLDDSEEQAAAERVEQIMAQELALALATLGGLNERPALASRADRRLAAAMAAIGASPRDLALYRLPRGAVLCRLLPGVDPRTLSTN